VDDGSTDDSIAIATSALREASQPNMVIASSENRGASAARNLGLRSARGDWIQFLDADDLIAPDKLELQARSAAQVPDDVGVVMSTWQYLQLRCGRWQPTEIIRLPDWRSDVVFDLLLHRSLGYVGPKLIRKRHVEAVSGFDEGMPAAEDMDLMFRLALSGAGFREAASDKPLYWYRLEVPNSLSRSCPAKRGAEMIMRIGEKVEPYLRARYAEGLPASGAAGLRAFYSWALTVLFEEDRKMFADLLRSIRSLDPGFQPSSPAKRFASRFVGYENSERLGRQYRRAKRSASSVTGFLMTALHRLEHF